TTRGQISLARETGSSNKRGMRMSDRASDLPDVPKDASHFIKKSPEFRVIYSNVFQYRLTISDISIVFGTLADSGPDSASYEQRQEAAVIMSYGQAKNLAEYLTMIVTRYEREIGPVLGIGKSVPQESEVDGLFQMLQNIGVHR